jgi:hypothetical protein
VEAVPTRFPSPGPKKSAQVTMVTTMMTTTTMTQGMVKGCTCYDIHRGQNLTVVVFLGKKEKKSTTIGIFSLQRLTFCLL